jgi:hypothetical protein
MVEEDPNYRVRRRIEADAPRWAAMYGRRTAPKAGSVWRLALIADQDTDSKFRGADGTQEWGSHFRWGTLSWDGKNYCVDPGLEHDLRSSTADTVGRGAEFSALELFEGRLLTMDDRTASLVEIVAAGSGSSGDRLLQLEPLLCLSPADGDGVDMGKGSSSEPLALRVDGQPMKVEWAAVRDGRLVCGSTGSEFFNRDGSGTVQHSRAMCVSVVTPHPRGFFTDQQISWHQQYNTLRTACVCQVSLGHYMSHESARWSTVHSCWFFLPRKICYAHFSEELDEHSCSNLLLAVEEEKNNGWQHWSDEDVLVREVLTANPIRGTSDFRFIPGSSDCHLLILRTEEVDVGVHTYVSVVDLQGQVLMAETMVSDCRKYEGCELIDVLSGGGWEHRDALDRHAQLSADSKQNKRAAVLQYTNPLADSHWPRNSDSLDEQQSSGQFTLALTAILTCTLIVGVVLQLSASNGDHVF